MENFEIQVMQEAGVINSNFDELKQQLEKELAPYKNLTVSEDEIKLAKDDLAYLRKQRTEIESRRKEVKKAYSEPLVAFETSCKELTGIFDDAIKNISDQLDLFEQDRIARKRERISKLYEEQVGELLEFLPIEENYNTKWDNKSYSDNDIAFDISALKQKVMSDIEVIRSLSSEIEEDCLAAYKKAGNDLKAAIQKNNDYNAAKKLAEEKVKAEAEKKIEEAPATPVEEVKPVELPKTEIKEEEVIYFKVVGAENIKFIRDFCGLNGIEVEEIPG